MVLSVHAQRRVRTVAHTRKCARGAGDLDLKEVQAALEDSEIRRNSMISKEKADDLFASMDDDGSGCIDWEEFKRYFSTKKRPSAINLGLES